MAVTVRPLYPVEEQPFEMPPIPWHRILSAVMWCAAAATTYVVVEVFGLPGAVGVILAVALQAGFTYLESPIWRPWGYDAEREEHYKRSKTWISAVALGLDVITNITGAGIVVDQIHRFPPLILVAERLDWQLSPITGWAWLGITLFMATVIACVPEKLWHYE